jgi:5-methylcytosine-specific restriction endonuclease McrA
LVVQVSGDPFPKSSQLARGTRRYRRKVASPKQWQAIIAAKRGPCRVCDLTSGALRGPIEYHHLVERDAPHFGDDVADNIVPLHQVCHGTVTSRLPSALRKLADSLTHSEYAYVTEKLGDDQAMFRLFGVRDE